MSTSNKRQRELARQKFERQQQRRVEREAAERRRTRIVAGITGLAVVAVALGLWWFSQRDSGTPAASPTAQPVAGCTTPPEPTEKTQTWTSVPTATKPAAQITLATNCGDIVIKTLPAKAPKTVQSITFLTQQGYYTDSDCFRLTTSGLFVFQCGSPTNDGKGGPGYQIPDENLPTAKGQDGYPAGTVAMLPTRSAKALVVADAGYNGYELARKMDQAGVSFVIRMSGKDRLYTDKCIDGEKFEEGEIYLWNKEAQKNNLPPLRTRLIRIRAKDRRDVWLLTNVLDSKQLSAKTAGQYYRWRWENEGLFRTFKRTLAKVKLMSRTVRLIHREAESALLATQLLLAQGQQAMGQRPSKKAKPEPKPERCSPRKVLLVIRDVISGKIDVRNAKRYTNRMQAALREDRQRTSLKEKRQWPGRAKHKPQKPPNFLKLSRHEKALARKLLQTKPSKTS